MELNEEVETISWYDSLSRLIVSQSRKRRQNQMTDNRVSFRFGCGRYVEIVTHRKAQTSPAREGKLDAVASLVPATLFRSARDAEPSDARGRSFIRLEGVWILGSAGYWRRGSTQ